MAVSHIVPQSPWDLEYYTERGFDFFLVEVTEIIPGSARVRVKDRGEMIMFGGYSYLGLIGHPKINAAARDAIDRYGTGTNGVRLLAGTLPVHVDLEKRAAEFVRAESCITFSSGYVANVSTISALLDRHDTVICDRLDHASIVDGCRLSGATMSRFRHNDLDHLETQLMKAKSSSKTLVIVDGVYSMDGDIADLPGIKELCVRYGAFLMVDEAHSLGVIGATGRGIEEHFGMPADTIDIKMGTFSKSIPSAGGYVAGATDMTYPLKYKARGFIYSGAVAPASAAASLAALDVIQEEPERVQRLQANYTYFLDKLRSEGFNVLSSSTAIAPIVCGDGDSASRLMLHCVQNGIFVQAIQAPVVPQGLARLRAAVTSNHTTSEMDYCVDVMAAGARSLGII